MTWRVLVSAPYMLTRLEQHMETLAEHDIEIVVADVRERLGEEQLLKLVSNIDGAMCGDDQYTERVMKAAPRLRVISKWGTGIDSIDQEAAGRLGIRVCNTPGAFADPVADSVMSYVLAFARQTPWMDRDVRSGIWKKRMGISLRECTLGVIGVGAIGRSVVRRAAAFGMRLLGNDTADVPKPFVKAHGLEMMSLSDLLEIADYVSLNCDLNPTSHHLIGAPELGVMKPTAYLINTARGPLVDEQALVEALEGGGIAGAALDVFELEPLPAESPLRGLDNTMLAPHNANVSPVVWQRVDENTIANLLQGLREVERGPRDGDDVR